MVQNKHQKSKPKKQPQVKKHGKQADISQFRAQLDALGLKIIQVTADGNCFFRALADQLEGNEEQHGKYRHTVVQYIMQNREMFEPFIEDEVQFDDYCHSMEKDGTWAGNMELQAASLVTRYNICIHRHMSPRWYIQNFDNQGSRMIHLSYHDGEHYNSVRSKEDPCDGSARPIVIKVDVNLTASSQQAKAQGASPKSRTSRSVVQGGAIKMIMDGSGCEDAEKAEQVLLQVDHDVDAAVEFLIADQEAGETFNENNVLPQKDNNGNGEKKNSDRHQNGDVANGKDQSKNIKKVDNDKLSCKAEKDKNIPRNKVCPCGSKKKYKACCGTASRKKLVDQEPEAESIKGKRGKKQWKKDTPIAKAPSHGLNEALPDMGALCI